MLRVCGQSPLRSHQGPSLAWCPLSLILIFCKIEVTTHLPSWAVVKLEEMKLCDIAYKVMVDSYDE